MAYTIAFFGTKPYDEASFNEKNKEFGFELRFFKGHLNRHNVLLTQGVDAVCIFVNDTADAEVIRTMAANGVKLLALRCAGYNNVDLKAADENGVTVVRVPAYSPYAVAEYTVALMLSLNRKIPKTCILAVGFWIFQVDFIVCDIQITAQYRCRFLLYTGVQATGGTD